MARSTRWKNTASAMLTTRVRQTGVAIPRARRATSSPGQSASFPATKPESLPTRTPMVACPSRLAVQATTAGTGQSPYMTTQSATEPTAATSNGQLRPTRGP